MSENKQRGPTAGKPKPELTKLKDLWRDTLTEDAKGYWRSRFASSDFTQAQNRDALRTKLKINLTDDSQLTHFRKWLRQQDEIDAEEDLQQQDEARAIADHPDWSDDQRRMYVINCSLNRAITTGDFKGLGLKAVRAGQNEKVIALDTEKFKEGLRSKLETGLEQLAQHIKGNAKAQAAYEAFKATIAESTK